MMKYRDCLTPDFIHFVTCVVEDEANFVCIMLYWLFWKCFLTVDPNVINKYDTRRRVEDRIKIVARALIELVICLILMGSTYEYSFYPWLYCLSVFIFFAAGASAGGMLSSLFLARFISPAATGILSLSLLVLLFAFAFYLTFGTAG